MTAPPVHQRAQWVRRRTRRWVRSRSTPAIRWNRRHSCSIGLAFDARIDALQESPHLLGGTQGDEFYPVAVRDCLYLLTWQEAESVTNRLWDYDLELWRDSNCFQNTSIDIESGYDYCIDRYCVCHASAVVIFVRMRRTANGPQGCPPNCPQLPSVVLFIRDRLHRCRTLNRTREPQVTVSLTSALSCSLIYRKVTVVRLLSG